MKITENEDGSTNISEAYSGFSLITDAGEFGICQRDGGIEIYLAGTLVAAYYSKERSPQGLLMPNKEGVLVKASPDLQETK